MSCDHHCQMSWETGACCYTADLNETQFETCDACEDYHGGMDE